MDDVLHCSVNGTVPTGVRMSPVLHKDKRYKEQLGRNTTLVTGVIVFLGAADVRELPNNVEIMPGVGQKRWELVSVARDAVLRSEVESEEAVKLRYGICLMTQIAPGAEMLHAWVNYHRRIGVDHVYVFDNGAKKEYMDLLRGREDVEVVPWPFHKSQLQVVSYFLFLARDRCRHVVLSDVDEYVMLGVNDYDKTRTGWRPLQKYVGKMQRAGYNNVKFPYVTMRNSGYRRRPAAETVEAYVHRKKDQDYLNGKSLCTTDDNYQSGMIHSCGRVGVGMKGRQASLFREWVPHQWNESFVDLQTWRDVALVVHYRERSWEDWIDKMNAGWVSGALVADTESGKLSIDKPPEWYMHVSDELRWEGFRNIYRRVTKWEPGTVRLVYSRAGRGCIVEEGRDSCAKSD